METPFSSTAAAPAIGALCAEALAASGFPVLLKWPNDLIQQEESAEAPSAGLRKVGGILLEEYSGVLTAGIGINTDSCPPPSMLRDGFAVEAGVLHGGKLVRNFTLWLQLAANIFSCYESLKQQDAWWVKLTEHHMAFMGCPASLADALPESLEEHAGTASGTVAGITRSGALLLKTTLGTAAFLGGSLFPLQQ